MLKAACNKDVQLSFLHHGPCAQTPENTAMLGESYTRILVASSDKWTTSLERVPALLQEQYVPFAYLSEVRGINLINHFWPHQ